MTMAWCFADESSKDSDAVLEKLVTATIIVPQHWFLEVTNVLAMAEKRRRISQEQSSKFLELLKTFDIKADDQTANHAFQQTFMLCREHGLTTYDAAYLEVAVRRGLPLASLDKALRKCAGKIGVVLL